MSNVMAPFQLLELNVISAQDLAPVGRSMRTYAVAWVHPDRKLSTRVDTHGHNNPTWNDKFVFRVDEEFLYSDTSAIMIEIYALHWFRDIHVGTVRVLVGNLIPPPSRPFHNNRAPLGMRFVALQVRRPSGRPQGILNIGVTVLDSSMRSMPLYTLNSSAVGYRHLMGEKDAYDSHNHLSPHAFAAKPELRRTKSDTSSMIGSEAVARKQQAKPSKGKASSVITVSEVSSRTKKKGRGQSRASSMVSGFEGEKASSILSDSGFQWGIKNEKASSMLSASEVEEPPNNHAVINFDDKPDSSINGSEATTNDMHRHLPEANIAYEVKESPKPRFLNSPAPPFQTSPPPQFQTSPPPQFQTSSPSQFQKSPTPQFQNSPAPQFMKSPTPQFHNSPAHQFHNSPAPQFMKSPAPQYHNSPAPQFMKSPAPQYHNSPAPQFQKSPAPQYQNSPAPKFRNSPAPQYRSSPAPQFRNSPAPQFHNSPAPQFRNSPAPQFTNSPAPQFRNSPAVSKFNPKVGFGVTPRATPLHPFGKLNGAFEYGTPRRSNLGTMAPPILTESELGPSPSEVAAAMARKPAIDEGENSTVGGWSLDESVEGLQSKLERWRTELPTVYDRGELSSFPTSSTKTSQGHNRRHTDGGNGLFSCFSTICGVECSIVCGGDSKAKKNRRRRTPSVDNTSFL